MIEYTVVLMKPALEGGYVGYYLHAARNEELRLSAAKLTQEIRGGMFDATLEFTIDTFHRYYHQPITPMMDTVLVYDGTEEIFRGRPVSVQTDSRGRRKVTCEGDIHFLKDVPDLFTELRAAKTVYKIGSEKGAQGMSMRTIPTGDLEPRGGADNQLSRFGEKQTWNNLTVYRSEVTGASEEETEYGKRVGISSTGHGNTRYENYLLQAEDVGKVFTVEVDGDDGEGNSVKRSYEMTLHAATCRVWMYYGNGVYDSSGQTRKEVTGVIRYLGNLSLIAGASGPYDTDDFDADEAIIGLDGTPDTTAGALNFCIVQYATVPHWYLSRRDLLFWTAASETIFYQAQTGATNVNLKVYRDEGTTVRAMVNGMLNRYGEADKGYNRYAGELRKIYRGHIEADGAVTYESVGSCYESLEKWLSETGGYAKISVREVEGPDGEMTTEHFLDLTIDSGEKSDAFYVRRGENLMDLTVLHEGDGMATGIFVRGVWDGNDSDEGEADPDYELLLTSLNAVEVTSAQGMNPSEALRYRYTGAGEAYYPQGYQDHSGLYQYVDGLWKEITLTPGTYPTVDAPYKMTDPGAVYLYTGEIARYRKGRYYVYHPTKHIFTVDGEGVYPTPADGFSVDTQLGVIWNEEAREEYGAIVIYTEVDVSAAKEASRTQYMVDRGQEELRKRLTAFETMKVNAADLRLVGLEGEAPKLGNYYKTEDPLLGTEEYKQLTKFETDMIQPSRGSLTFGKKRNTLSAWVREKGAI